MDPYLIKIDDIARETPDCVSIQFDIPDKWKSDFRFEPGQHLTIIYGEGRKEVRRTYSLCTSPRHGIWKIAVKRVEGGYFSNLANDVLKPGDVLRLLPPIGHFTLPLHASNQNTYVAFAGGSGITPVISNIRAGLESEPNSRFILIFSNRTKRDIIFLEEIEGLKNTFMDRFAIFHNLTREKSMHELFSGRINHHKLEKIGQSIFDYRSVDYFLLCGPFDMVECIRSYMSGAGVPRQRILSELFYVPEGKTHVQTEQLLGVREDPSDDEFWEIRYQGNIHRMPSPGIDGPILDLVRDRGIDLPYACKGGVCASCKARLIKGQVDMKSNYALVDEELDNGFVLTCQSHARSNHIVLDFDTRS